MHTYANGFHKYMLNLKCKPFEYIIACTKNHVPRLVKGFFKVDIQTATAIEL